MKWLQLVKEETKAGKQCILGDQCPLGPRHERAVAEWFRRAVAAGEVGIEDARARWGEIKRGVLLYPRGPLGPRKSDSV